jgi:hypothetical protein
MGAWQGMRARCQNWLFPIRNAPFLVWNGIRITSPTSDFYKGMGIVVLTFVTSLGNFSCVAWPGRRLRGRNYTDANGQDCTGKRLCLGVVRAPCAFKIEEGSQGCRLLVGDRNNFGLVCIDMLVLRLLDLVQSVFTSSCLVLGNCCHYIYN